MAVVWTTRCCRCLHPWLAPWSLSRLCARPMTNASTRTSAGRVFRLRWKHLHGVAGYLKSKLCCKKVVVCRDTANNHEMMCTGSVQKRKCCWKVLLW
jgi:hypothetical protein